MKLFSPPPYPLCEINFTTFVKPTLVAKSLAEAPVPGVELLSPEPLSDVELLIAHDRRYIRAIRSGAPRMLAESSDIPWAKENWVYALNTNGGMRDAALAALASKGNAGSLSCGLHHARRKRGLGYCTFNGLAIAAFCALAEGAQSVLILDLDAHGGGGTHELIESEKRIVLVDVTTDEFDSHSARFPSAYWRVRDAAFYLDCIECALNEVDAKSFDLCLYNAGVDSHEGCRIGGLRGITTEIIAKRERLVFSWAKRRNIPVAFTLAGGYPGEVLELKDVVDLHRLTIAEAALSVPECDIHKAER